MVLSQGFGDVSRSCGSVSNRNFTHARLLLRRLEICQRLSGFRRVGQSERHTKVAFRERGNSPDFGGGERRVPPFEHLLNDVIRGGFKPEDIRVLWLVVIDIVLNCDKAYCARSSGNARRKSAVQINAAVVDNQDA